MPALGDYPSTCLKGLMNTMKNLYQDDPFPSQVMGPGLSILNRGANHSTQSSVSFTDVPTILHRTSDDDDDDDVLQFILFASFFQTFTS
jgi:hypothetical protein